MRHCRNMGLDMRPPLFVHLLGQGGTVSLHVPFQATSEALSDNAHFSAACLCAGSSSFLFRQHLVLLVRELWEEAVVGVTGRNLSNP